MKKIMNIKNINLKYLPVAFYKCTIGEKFIDVISRERTVTSYSHNTSKYYLFENYKNKY